MGLCRWLVAVWVMGAAMVAGAQERDLTGQYEWKPVRIGAGGFVVGVVVHPLDPAVRYARTDVGNAYRWDKATQSWFGMRLANADGSGIRSAAAVAAPSGYGVESIAVDPANQAVVYLVFSTETSCDLACSKHVLELYKSVDGGRNFVPLGFGAAQVKGDANGVNRANGERLEVDPRNGQAMYFGSERQGLWRSADGGWTWTRVRRAAGLPEDVEFVNVQFGRGGREVYAVSVRNGKDAGGDVYESTDGGGSWRDLSLGVVDAASGQRLSGQAASSSMDAAGALYVVENAATDGGHRAYWRFADGVWRRVSLEGAIGQPLTSVAIDPTDLRRLYAVGVDTSMSRSDDGGATWTSFGEPRYANRFGWLPQQVGMQGGDWHSNGGLKIDARGDLWLPTGQEGILTMRGAEAAAGTAANPPKWTIESRGIEEQVAQDVAVLRDGTVIAAAEDTTGFVVRNPDDFCATQIPLQQEIIAQGTSVDGSPDVPGYVAITSSNVYTHGVNYSGYSADGGASWTRFGRALQVQCGGKRCDAQAGQIAVGARGARKLGEDHLVIEPPDNLAPEYSRDGGATWQVSRGFPLAADGLTLDVAGGKWMGFPIAQLQQRLLRADPFVEDRFYLKLTHAPSSLYVSTDGGASWTGQAGANLPDYAWHGQLAVNAKVRGDLWYADGWEGSTAHGLFHSIDGGASFARVPAIAHALVVAIGAGGDAQYAVYFYGQLTGDEKWGVFQSVDGGMSWNRVAFYPMGIYDRPTAMAASLETFGKVYLGFSGDSFVYGELRR